MPKNDTPASTLCPVENATVDAERCAACYRRGSSSATCTSEDRLSRSDLSFLLRAL